MDLNSRGFKVSQESLYQKWFDLINSAITDREFQYLCVDLLNRRGFINPRVRGRGADGGRDIEADCLVVLPTGETVFEKYWISCKKQKDGIGWDSHILKDITRAANDSVDKFIIMSNAETTSPCQDEIKKWNQKNRCRIIDWTGKTFVDALWLLPDLCRNYFPSENLPTTQVRTPERMLDLSKKEGAQLNVHLEFKLDSSVNPNDIDQVTQFIKQKILTLENIDVNLKAMLCEKTGMLLFGMGKGEDALTLIDKSLDINPNNEAVLLNKGFILESLYRLDNANEAYEQILKRNPKNIFALSNQAQVYLLKGEYETALKSVESVLSIDESFIIGIKTKAEILKLMGKEKEALDYLYLKNQITKDSIIIKITKVDILMRLLDLRGAFGLNEEILKISPNYVVAINQKGAIYERNSRYQNRDKYLSLALDQFQTVAKTDKKFNIGWTNQAVIYINQGNLQKAKEVLEEAKSILPEFPHYWNKLGVCYLFEKIPKQALKCFEHALKMTYDEEFLINQLRALLELRQYDQIIKITDKPIIKDSTNSDVWGIRGEAFRKLRLDSRAKQCFEKAQQYYKQPISLLED